MTKPKLAVEKKQFAELKTQRKDIIEHGAADDFASPVSNWQDFEGRLRQMTCAYKQARFDSRLRHAALNLYAFIGKQERKETSDFWKALTLLYELNDIFHLDTNINNGALTVGKLVQDELRGLSIKWDKGEKISDEERKLTREKVMYCACRGNELKRHGETETAGKLFQWLSEFTTNKLRTDQFPCYGTQARLSYHLGSVFRILEQHNAAEDMYTKTLELLYERAKRRSDTDSDDHLFIMRRQAMAIGIGFGWVNLTRGSLRRAENALTTARSLLARISDPIVPSYIELLYGTIKRCRAGTNRPKLEEAIQSLKNAKQAFEEHGHTRYIPRVCWELGLAANLVGRFEEAQEYLNEVSAYAEKVGHPKWQTNVKILQSRILRNQGGDEAALREAELAVIKAEDCNSILPRIDAYITRGEAKLRMAEKRFDSRISVASARADFEKALEVMIGSRVNYTNANLPSNPKIVAVCELRVAQCFAREGDETKARHHFGAWDILRSNVEHEWVRELADNVKSEIDGLLMNFTISAKDSSDWDYTKNVTKLRSWLLAQALRRTKKNYSAAAQLIGVKRATLYQWQDDSRNQTGRARTKGPERETLKT